MVSTPSSHRTRAPQTKSRSNAKKNSFPVAKNTDWREPTLFPSTSYFGHCDFSSKAIVLIRPRSRPFFADHHTCASQCICRAGMFLLPVTVSWSVLSATAVPRSKSTSPPAWTLQTNSSVPSPSVRASAPRFSGLVSATHYATAALRTTLHVKSPGSSDAVSAMPRLKTSTRCKHMLALRPVFHVHVPFIQVADCCKKTREFFEGLRVCTHLPEIAFE